MTNLRYLNHFEHDHDWTTNLCVECMCPEVAWAIQMDDPDYDNIAARSCGGCYEYACKRCGLGCTCGDHGGFYWRPGFARHVP